ncbi:hypothetical protein GKG03_08175 [Finegoldia sp. BIOML-A3]|uniref:hypothetical protein n=1 Tax=unclassified Finegoldia TaxID=2619637 RepID=UPI0012AFB89A|nr:MULTISPECIES: hypothetical protein [unclassified Finegoldia]MSA99655.1 hypothetical protein [Finegoldia sp. BIOML-A3]MSB93641.1 hypothetical protein [Finegoldia sp. BIOML-A4]
MEKRVSDFNDEVWAKFKRSKDVSKRRSIGNCKKIKRKRIEKVDRLDDMRTVGNLCIMLLKFFVLLNILVITSRML